MSMYRKLVIVLLLLDLQVAFCSLTANGRREEARKDEQHTQKETICINATRRLKAVSYLNCAEGRQLEMIIHHAFLRHRLNNGNSLIIIVSTV